MKNSRFIAVKGIKLVVLGLGFLLLFGSAILVGSKLAMRMGWTPSRTQVLEFNETGSYLSARHAIGQGKMADAQAFFEQGLKHAPENVLLQRGAYQAALLSGAPEEMAKASLRINPQTPAAVPPAMLNAILMASQGKFREANEAMNLYIPQGFHALFAPLMKGWLQAGLQTSAKAFKAPSFAAGKEFSVLMHYHAARLNEFMGHQEEAQQHFDVLLKQAPVLPSRVMEVLLANQLKQSKQKEAQALLDAYAERIPDHYLSLARAATVLPVKDAKEGLAEVLNDISGVFTAMQASEEALIYARLALLLAPDFAEPRYILAGLYERFKQSGDAIDAYAKINPSHPLYIKGQIRSAYLLQGMEKTSDALAVLDKVGKAYGEPYDVLMARADMLRDHKEFEKSAQTYTKALTKIGETKSYHWTIYFARGAAYERAQQWDKAEPDLLKALSLSPSQPEVLNYLGYSWLLLGKNIPQAKAMIERALQLSPRDIQIVDSMGWALYQLGQFEEALVYLEQAADTLPQDATVNEHLGDLYWQLGRQHEAMYLWQRAYDAKEHEAGQKKGLEKKLQEGLPAWEGKVVTHPAQASSLKMSVLP